MVNICFTTILLKYFLEKYPRDITKLSLFQTSDKQILHHQCQARFYDYQYVGLLDKDEYLIPNPQKFGFSLKSYLVGIIIDSVFTYSYHLL